MPHHPSQLAARQPPDMATFDNPSYFTIAGQQQLPVAVSQESGLSAGAKPKRFRNWLSRIGPKNNNKLQNKKIANLNNYQPPCPSPEPAPELNAARESVPEVVYYNFTSTAPPSLPANTEEAANDDVFADNWATPGSTRTLTRRRHSFGSWFRSSLAAVRKQSTTSSTGSGLESTNQVDTPSGHHRPSTSSERALLPRAVSTSANCVSYRSSRDVNTPELGRTANSNVSSGGGGEVKGRRSRLPVAVKSNVELRARARYARQTDSNNKATASASRIPRPIHQQSASLDRRYTNSTEVLTNEHRAETHPALPSSVPSDQRPETEDRFQPNGLRDSPCASMGGRRRGSGSNTPSRNHRLMQRSRTIEDRQRTSCCGRMAAAAPSSSSSSRRRSSMDAVGQPSRRRCQRCRDKAEASDAQLVDVVIIFSKNCVVAQQWITYLSEVLNNLFRDSERPPTRISSRVVEDLVSCGSAQQPDSRFERSDYQNDEASEQLELERSARQHAMRKTVSSASLQIVLLSKSLLNHIGLHANDPLGGLLHPKRVLGVLLGLDERKDITQLHISALYSFEYWPKVTMLDQDLDSVTEFHSLARSILCRSQPAALAEAKLQPARFKLTPRKLRSGEERVTLILLETGESIQSEASVYVGGPDSGGGGKEPIRVDKLSWPNPYTITFSVPREFLERDMIVKVQLKVGAVHWGTRDLKCSSKLGELSLLLGKKQLIGNPLDLMCQALSISPMDHKALDAALSQNLEKKNIMGGSLFRFEDPVSSELSEEEFPTLIHFAARFGFDQLLRELLRCPGAHQAIQLRNCNGQTALQVAQANEHQLLVGILQSFVELDNSGGHKESDDYDYVLMNASTEGPQVAPLAHDDYDVLPPAKPFRPEAEEELEKEEEELQVEPEPDYLSILHEGGLGEEEEGATGGPVELRERSPALSARDKKVRTVQDELRDVLDQYKNGMINSRQAEIFFDAWKQRKDVQEDADKKRELLEQMGEEAKRNWELHKKKSTKKDGNIFKRFLGGNKSTGQAGTKSPAEETVPESPFGGIKPTQSPSPSSLSPVISARQELSRGTSPYNSWSGSDRSSVTSRVSSHDSGAHSDSPEERKALLIMRNDYDVPLPTESSLKTSNYLIPPPPRPVEAAPSTAPMPPSGRPPARNPSAPGPRPPPKPVRPFEFREFNPPASQSNLAEDLGRILPSEEPDVMEQAPILLPISLPTSPIPLLQTDMQSDYLPMSPRCDRKNAVDDSVGAEMDDDYVRPEEIHMPPRFFASYNSRKLIPPAMPGRLSTSASKLPTSEIEAAVTEWRSDPSLNLGKVPPPVAPRKIWGGVPPVPAPTLGPSLPAQTTRPVPPPRPDFLKRDI